MSRTFRLREDGVTIPCHHDETVIAVTEALASRWLALTTELRLPVTATVADVMAVDAEIDYEVAVEVPSSDVYQVQP